MSVISYPCSGSPTIEASSGINFKSFVSAFIFIYSGFTLISKGSKLIFLEKAKKRLLYKLKTLFFLFWFERS